MSSNESEASESYADRIRRNDKSLTCFNVYRACNVRELKVIQMNTIENLDALKNNTVVQEVFIKRLYSLPNNHEVFVLKLSEVMKCNKSVKSLTIHLERWLLGERAQLFAGMAISGGWSSIQDMVLKISRGDYIEPLSLREKEYLSSFFIQSEDLRTLTLEMTGDEAAPIVETLSRTKVQSLKIHFSTVSIQSSGRQLATALERCTCITELRLESESYSNQEDFFQILLVESIPNMLGLKKLELKISRHSDQQRQFFGMVGQCIGGHQGEIEELRLIFHSSSVNLSSIVRLAPALRRLKVIRFDGFEPLTSQQTSELSEIAEDCDALEEFGSNLVRPSLERSSENFKAICQLLSKFPSLKRVTQVQVRRYAGGVLVDLCEEGRFVAFLGMVQTSKTIEQVPPFQCRNAEEEAAITHHCHHNKIRNRFDLIRKKGLLGATVPSSAWPLILKKFSDMPDVLYYLLQQKHGAMIGPRCHGCNKRKQDFGES